MEQLNRVEQNQVRIELNVETQAWLVARVSELIERFEITSPVLLAQILGYPETHITSYMKNHRLFMDHP